MGVHVISALAEPPCLRAALAASCAMEERERWRPFVQVPVASARVLQHAASSSPAPSAEMEFGSATSLDESGPRSPTTPSMARPASPDAGSPGAAKEAAPGARRRSLLERRRAACRFTGRPSIDCTLVHQEHADREHPFRSPSALDRFDVQEALGQGTTGVVYAARRKEDGKRVAMKLMRINDEELLHTARQEFEVLRGINHPHIIQALEFFTYRMGAVLVMEHFPGRTLEVAAAERPEKRLEETEAKTIFVALLQAIAHLHKLGIIHRDVKAQNILVSDDLLDLKLVDFNTAQRTSDGGGLTMTGTVDYLPPEVLLGESLSEGSDLWAAGLCLRLMLSGSLPLERRMFSSHGEFGRAVTRHRQRRVSGLSEPCADVLRQCLEVDPQWRPSAAELLANSAWLLASPNGKQVEGKVARTSTPTHLLRVERDITDLAY